MRRTLLRPAAVPLTIAASLLALAVSSAAPAVPPAAAAAASARLAAARPLPPTARPLPASTRQVCQPSSQPGMMSCQAVVRIARQRPAVAGASATSPVSQYGYGPASLLSAYGLVRASARGGKGETVAVVDAYNNPDLAASLAIYRRQFGLPPCTSASGCLRILNQAGKTAPLPKPNDAWSLEEAVDLEMISAICPYCRIVLVEASYPSITNLGLAEDTAAATGARFINNSWAGAEFTGETTYDKYFDHPGDAVSVASGDYGYAVSYPAASQFVTAVGGTTLLPDKSARRHWIEHAWGSGGIAGRNGSIFFLGTGSGCSMLEPKPAWQREKVDDTPAGCLNRTDNDVSADADPDTGVAVYDAFAANGPWLEIGGTSVSTAIITGVYALAGTPAPGTYPASYPYRDADALFDVVGGSNGTCEPTRSYLCNAVRGYNGPTGLGTPDGVGAFGDHGALPVTLQDPGTQDVGAGARFWLRITGLDARQQATSLAYGATGLPRGLSIRATPGSTDAVISGMLPQAPASQGVTVTARDGVTGQTGSVHFMIVSVASLTATGDATGRVSLHDTGLCLDGVSGQPGSAVTLEPCVSAAGQHWKYTSGRAPGSAGTLSAGTQCLGRSWSGLVLATCQPGAAGQGWVAAGYGMLRNAEDGGCLAVARMSAGQRVGLGACNEAGTVRWTLPGGLLVAGGRGLCAAGSAANDIPTPIEVVGCQANTPDQVITLHGDGAIEVNGNCFDVPGPSLVGTGLDGAAVVQNLCEGSTQASQIWLIGPGGELINDYSGKCLDDLGDGGSGTALVQEDCYGTSGEVWAVN
jgi:hypothetical protein